MGSFGDHAKGQQPMLDRIRQHNAEVALFLVA
jgi:hypothetical protein